MLVTADSLDSTERERHERCMAHAIEAALLADAPFGAVVTGSDSEAILCVGHNRHEASPILHGEIDALLAANRMGRPIDWQRTTLYSTGEPCPMCMAAIIWCRIPEVIFATSIETLAQLGIPQILIDSPRVAAASPFDAPRIVGGVLADQTDRMFADWIGSRQ